MDLFFYFLIFFFSFLFAYLHLFNTKYKAKESDGSWNYERLKKLIDKEKINLPAIFVHLQNFDENVKIFSSIANRNSKTIRIGFSLKILF